MAFDRVGSCNMEQSCERSDILAGDGEFFDYWEFPATDDLFVSLPHGRRYRIAALQFMGRGRPDLSARLCWNPAQTASHTH